MTRWAILRTSPAQTLPLMRSLREAGFDVWSPARTVRRVLYAGRKAERRDEIDVPILPTFVFAREIHFEALCGLADSEPVLHPAFSVFARYRSVPFVGDRQIAGLQAEEARERAVMQEIRDAETYQEAQRIRRDNAKNQAARRRAERELERAQLQVLRGKPMTFKPGAEVNVTDMPAMVGLVGIVEGTEKGTAVVQFGLRSFKIEGWRLLPAPEQQQAA